MANGRTEGCTLIGEAVATLIEAERTEILAAYVRGLEDIDSPIVRQTSSREQAIAQGAEVLAEVTQSLRAGDGHPNLDHRLIAWDTGDTSGAADLPAQLTEVMVLSQVTTSFVARRLGADAMSLQLLMVVLLALNQSINTQVGGAAATYAGYLLGKIHEAHLAERHRIARELHDRIGNMLSVAYRQLELFDLHRETESAPGSGPIETAQRSIVESMESLRAVASGLRLHDPIASLDKALATYLESTQASNVEVCLQVSGDDAWAPPAVRDESFLVIREAISNALTHANPTRVFVGVDIGADALHAIVEDNGCGFESACGLGLLSMRERATLMGGNVTVSSKRHHGTRVELLAPLSGNHHAATK